MKNNNTMENPATASDPEPFYVYMDPDPDP